MKTESESLRSPSVIGVVTFAWIAVLGGVSFLPYHYKHELHTQGRFHSLGHFFAFSVTAALLTSNTRWLRDRLILLILAVGFAYAIEIGQHLLYHSKLERSDMVVDTVGILLGPLLGFAVGRFVSRRYMRDLY
jgi:VanZ family protein